MARKIVYGPSKFGGLAWETCGSIQILEKVKLFLTHVRREDKIGIMLRIKTDTVQLYTGLIQPVLYTTIKCHLWVENT